MLLDKFCENLCKIFASQNFHPLRQTFTQNPCTQSLCVLLSLVRKNQTRHGAKVTNSKTSKIVTAVFSNSKFFSFSSNNELREYQVEVITFDGDSETIYVEAHDADEAQEIASNMVADADYVMVQGIA